MVLGSYLDLGAQSGGQIRLDVHIQDTSAGGTIASVSETGSEANLLELISTAGGDLRGKLGIGNVSPSDVEAIRASLPSSPEAARLYSEGLVRLRLFDALAARNLLERAVIADPAYALAHSALADAWSTMGYDERAQQEAKKAFDLSDNLSREEKLWVEGRYFETSKNWNAAIVRYRTLFSFAPDNIDYGLRLVHVQTKASKTADAKQSLAALRNLPPPARDDPRIDLAEASLAEAQGDFKHEQLAASRATSKGKDQGARLLTAKSLRTEAWALVNLSENEDATKKADSAQALYDVAGDRNGVASCLNIKGTVLLNEGDLPGATGIYKRELALYQEIGNKTGIAFALNNIGAVFLQQGDLAGARKILGQTLAVFHEVGDRYSEAYTLNNMATVMTSQADFREAKRVFEQSLAIFQQIREEDGAAYAWVDLAAVYQQQGELAQAKKTYDHALVASRHTGDKMIVADALFGLGDVAFLQGRLSEARKFYSDSLSVRSEVGDKAAAAESRMALSELAIEEGHAADVESSLRETREEFRRDKATDDEITSDAVLARALRMQGKISDAAHEIETARPLTNRTQSVAVRLKLDLEDVRVHAESGQVAEARRILEPLFAQATRTGLLLYQLEGRLTLAELERKSGYKGARAHLEALEKDARQSGFALLANKAREARR